MEKAFYLLVFVLVATSCGLVSDSIINDNKETYDIEFLNSHADEFDGKLVRVVGYVYSGFDGHHHNCEVGGYRGAIPIEAVSFINSPECFDGYKENFRHGVAEVTGVFTKADIQFLINGTIYASELKDASINWDP